MDTPALTESTWKRLSRVLDFVMTHEVKEQPGEYTVKAEKPKKQKKVKTHEQMRLF